MADTRCAERPERLIQHLASGRADDWYESKQRMLAQVPLLLSDAFIHE